MSYRCNRREWLRLTAGALPALFLAGCWKNQRPAESPATLLLGCSADLADPKRSFLFLANWREKTVRQISIPIANAHSVVLRNCGDPRAWVLGVEAGHILPVNLATGEAGAPHKIGAGTVTSGHGVFFTRENKEFLVTTEYPENEPGKGTLCVRDPTTLEELERVPSGGAYPHVVSIVAGGDLAVQNLGQKAGEEYYFGHAEIVILDAHSLRKKSSMLPGKQKNNFEFSQLKRAEARAGEIAHYQLDTKRVLYPNRRVLAVEDPEHNLVTLWNREGGRALREIEAPHPVHSYLLSEAQTLVIALESGGAALLPKGAGDTDHGENWLRAFRTQKHLGLFTAECRAQPL